MKFVALQDTCKVYSSISYQIQYDGFLSFIHNSNLFVGWDLHPLWSYIIVRYQVFLIFLGMTTTLPITNTTSLATVEPTKADAERIGKGVDCKIFSFFCPNDNKCIHDNWVCDGYMDCRNGYDEDPLFCNRTCKGYKFTCPDGPCIPESQKCDGLKQCPGGQDELLPQCSEFVSFCI